jgi:hypothetical protein
MLVGILLRIELLSKKRLKILETVQILFINSLPLNNTSHNIPVPVSRERRSFGFQ